MGQPQKILICDDDELLVELLRFRLKARGFDVRIARNGKEAVESLRDDEPDAVVLDAMMPIFDGYEVLRQLRELPHLRDLPVIMLTARKSERDVLDALKLGASDFVAKPFIPEELTARLTKLLARGE